MGSFPEQRLVIEPMYCPTWTQRIKENLIILKDFRSVFNANFSSTGASVNQPDKYGRTPLHVAAAVDYPEMVQFLVQRGADLHAKTGKELQTPVHFAARNDATSSLKMLMKCGADITDKDFKQRTPLQVCI